MQVLVQDIPANVLDAVVADAQEQDVAVRALVVRRLAEHFGHAVSDRKPRKFTSPSTDDLNLEMTRDLRAALRDRAHETEGTIRGAVIEALAKRYKLPAPAHGRRTRRG